MSYRVDIRDVKFQIFEWLPTSRLLEAPAFSEWDRDSLEMVLDEALKIAQEQMAAGHVEGDRIGAQWHDGAVTLPPSFKGAFETVAEGGWIGMTASPEAGGMGLPDVIGTAVIEFFFGANVSLGTSVTLTSGAGAMIERFADDEQKRLFLEKLYTGQWAGTMCLTEPQAGSDVGAVKTRAVKQDDGTYMVSGEKIFITSGEHDLTENIIHLVLARTPGAAVGTRGLSLFIIPKIWVKEDGSLGEPNDVYCSNIEEKMGIHGSPTCSLVFGQNDGCRGLLLGEEQVGMKQMFMMMNGARIDVGLQGAAIAAAAHQQALAYAKERLQSRHWTAMRDPEAPPVPIIEHPDVRRMLLGAKAWTEAMRAILLQGAIYLDLAHVSEGEDRERYQSYAEVLTPICKAWASEWGVQVARWCLHVYGGYGYTQEFPVEQYVRDAEIATIYEGTNGIQALDFVGRKLALRDGNAVREMLEAVVRIAGVLADDPRLGSSAALLGPALQEIDATLRSLRERPDGIELSLLNAVPILEMFGTVLGARFLLEQADVARTGLAEILGDAGVHRDDRAAYRKLLADSPDAAFYHDKIETAIHFAHRALPTVAAQAAAVRAGERAPLEAVMRV
jgi:alkylation response protein AidB-like acyl-CoA dehydrogenase